MARKAGQGGLFLAVLTLTGCTPRSAAPPPNAPVNPNLQITLTTQPSSPRQLDPTQFTVTLRDARGHPVSGATVAADLTMPGMDMGPNRVALTPQGPGAYSGTGRFTMPGDWQANVTATHAANTGTRAFPVAVR